MAAIRLVVLGRELCRIEVDTPQPSPDQPGATPPPSPFAGLLTRGMDVMTDFFTRRFVRRRLL